MKRGAAFVSLLFALIASGTGLAVGAVTLLGPSHVRCEIPPLQTGIGQTAVNNCMPVSLIEVGAEIWPLPLLAIVVWSVAPLLAVLGALRLVHDKRGLALVALALVLEASAIISFVAGPLFLIWVLTPLVGATVCAIMSSAMANVGTHPFESAR